MNASSLVKLCIIAFVTISCAPQGQEAETSTAPLFPTETRTEEVAVLSTSYGDMVIRFYDQTPEHKANFIKLAKEGFYDSTTFHRVIEGFMIQGGDPNSKDDDIRNDGQGGPGYTLPAEIVRGYIHKKGAIAAARMGDNVNPEKRSSGSQFYLVHGRKRTERDVNQLLEQANNNIRQGLITAYVEDPKNADVKARIDEAMTNGNSGVVSDIIREITPLASEDFEPLSYSPEEREIYMNQGGVPYLDGSYTVFGEVIEGLALVDSIAEVRTGFGDRPAEDIPMTVRIQTMTIAPDGTIVERY